jgi:hypothetical protein
MEWFYGEYQRVTWRSSVVIRLASQREYVFLDVDFDPKRKLHSEVEK